MRPRPVVVGNVNVDMIMGPLAPWPRHGTECLLPYYELRVGGSAGNAALAFKGLGADPFLVTNVGSDLFADWLDAGKLKGTLRETLSPINAANLRAAHAKLESGTTIGKLVLKGW